MFGISWSELLVIAVALLIFVGPKDLPRLMQRIGRMMRDLNNASRELRNQIEIELREVPKPRDLVGELKGDAESVAGGPYAEIRELDAQLRRDLKDATEQPRFEPTPEAEKPADPGTGGHAG